MKIIPIVSKREQVSALLNTVFDYHDLSDIKKCSYKEDGNKIIVKNADYLPPIIKIKLSHILLIVYPMYEVIFDDKTTTDKALESVWNNVRQFICKSVIEGELIDKHWLSDIIVSSNGDSIILSGRKAITITYVRNNYESILQEAFSKEKYLLDIYYHPNIRFVKNNYNS